MDRPTHPGRQYTKTPWHPPTDPSPCSLTECAERLNARRPTLAEWRRRGWLGEALLPDGRIDPAATFRLWAAREARRGRPAVVAPEDLEALSPEARRTVALRPFYEARRIREQGEQARLARLRADLELRRMAGSLVQTAQVREAFRELAGACALELLMLAEGAWIEPHAAAVARAEAEQAGRRLQALADAVRLDQPLDDAPAAADEEERDDEAPEEGDDRAG